MFQNFINKQTLDPFFLLEAQQAGKVHCGRNFPLLSLFCPGTTRFCSLEAGLKFMAGIFGPYLIVKEALIEKLQPDIDTMIEDQDNSFYGIKYFL